MKLSTFLKETDTKKQGLTPKLSEEDMLDQIMEGCLHLRLYHIQTLKICLCAVRKDGRELRYVHNQTLEICLAAVRQNGYALKSVRDQTPEICRAAVRQNGYALQHVRNQNMAYVCSIAVSQNGLALQHVRNQTVEICERAVMRDPAALCYVDVSIFEDDIPEYTMKELQEKLGEEFKLIK